MSTIPKYEEKKFVQMHLCEWKILYEDVAIYVKNFKKEYNFFSTQIHLHSLPKEMVTSSHGSKNKISPKVCVETFCIHANVIYFWLNWGGKNMLWVGFWQIQIILWKSRFFVQGFWP